MRTRDQIAAARPGADRRRAGAAGEQRQLAEHGAGAELPDHLSALLDVEQPGRDDVDVVGRVADREQGRTGRQLDLIGLRLEPHAHVVRQSGEERRQREGGRRGSLDGVNRGYGDRGGEGSSRRRRPCPHAAARVR